MRTGRPGQQVLLILVSLLGCSCGPVAVDAEVRSWQAYEDVTEEREFVREIWGGEGRVILGKIVEPEDAQVASRIPFEADGSYCTALHDSRRLIFYAHGYEPLDVLGRERIQRGLFSAGTVHFDQAAAGDLRSLRVEASARRAAGDAIPVHANLLIRNQAYLWDDHGCSCGARVTVTVEEQTLEPGASAEFTGLSRIPYHLVLTAPGFIQREIEIDPLLSGAIDLPNVALDEAVTLRISRCRVRQPNGKWIGSDAIETGKITCDGDAEFRFTKERDGLGNSLELRMRPGNGEVWASFFMYDSKNFRDLGADVPNQFPAWDDLSLDGLPAVPYMTMEDGHLYLFRNDDVNGTEIELLFRVELVL